MFGLDDRGRIDFDLGVLQSVGAGHLKFEKVVHLRVGYDLLFII